MTSLHVKRMVNVLAIAFLVGPLTCALLGQAVSQINGTVHDDSGAVVPGVQITATQTETGAARSTVSDAAGVYILPNLPLGPYRLEASKQGFRTYVQTGIVQQVNSNPEIPIVLGVGQVTESVQVEANASAVETRAAGVGTVIENQRILDLPLNGRQPTDLITLSGLAVQTATSPGYNMNTGVAISVAGGMSFGVQYTLDGAPHLDTYDGTSMPLPFPDALQEFRFVTSTQDASNGGHSGAAVNAVTKSGSNAFHGDAFEFLRNASVNARDFFAVGSDGLKRNQFGGTFGGPIKKDKLFFFVGYQGTLNRQTPIATTTFVPTQQMISGDFTTFASPTCQQGRQVNLRAPFVNNKIDPAQYSKAALKIASKFPATSDPCGRYLTGTILNQNQLQVPARIDYQLSDKQSIFGRYMATRIDTKVPYDLTPNDLLTAGGVGSDDLAQSLSVGDTYLINSTTVNSFRLSGNRIGAYKPGANYFKAKDVGIDSYSYDPSSLYIQPVGGFTLPGNNAQFYAFSFAHVTNFGVNDDVSMVRGSHQFAFGVNLENSILWTQADAFSGGFFVLNGAATGLGMADFFTGQVSQLRQANPNPENLTQKFFGLYAQDTWKVTPRLTLTYGLRWTPFFPMSFRQSDLYNFSVAKFYAGQVSKVIPNAPPGFTYPGDSGFAGKAGIDTHWGNLDPRVAIAWGPFGDGKTAIRIGAGIAHDFIQQDLHENTSSVAPFRLTVVRSGISLDNPWAGFAGGDPFPYTYDPKHPVFPNLTYQTYLPVPPDMKTTEQYTWNFGIQRQFTRGWFVSGTYVGTQILHIWNSVELNPGQYIPGNCAAGQYGLTAPGPCSNTANVNQRRLLNLANPTAAAALGYLTQYDDGGTQNYNGLLLNTTWRMGSNVNLNANYTWSHCIGLPTTTLLNPGSNYVHQAGQNVGPVNRNLDVGDCGLAAPFTNPTSGRWGSQDRRHIANITLVAQTPRFSNNAMRVAASGWTFSTTFTARSGLPVTIFTGTDNALIGFQGNSGTQRPNQVLDNPYGDGSLTHYLNLAAFATPAPGTFGNLGVNNIRAPGFWEWDEAVSRQFQIREGQRLEVRFEAFDVTNSFRPGVPGTVTGSPNTFGVILNDATPPSPTTAPARVLQFAMKYVF